MRFRRRYGSGYSYIRGSREQRLQQRTAHRPQRSRILTERISSVFITFSETRLSGPGCLFAPYLTLRCLHAGGAGET